MDERGEREMERTDVYEVEIAKWDALASVPTSDESLKVLHPDFAAYTRQDSTMVGIAEFLGDLQGREVLELGNGMGEMTTLLARSGAHVTAIDISPASTAVARRRAELHGVEGAIEFVIAAGEQLPMGSDCFDVVVGKAVLHHLDVTRAAPELHRVLRPGGRAAFAEPLGTNPVIAFARDHLPYPGKNPRGADVPLSYEDIAAWEAPFSVAEHREVQLLEMVQRALGLRPMPLLRRADEWLLARFPGLGRLCRYVVITMVN
jgi:2-polyprenyl-3-methyl-5-hydroxy-6-metoxy-1,4-benzoquinol methylase